MPTLTEKIIKAHLQEGTMDRGCPIAIKIDQTLTQDATGTMAYLQLEAMVFIFLVQVMVFAIRYIWKDLQLQVKLY